MLYPRQLVGTDSHTTMLNGLGVVAGSRGIEAERRCSASRCTSPARVVGVHLHGRLHEGATATDLVLRITELLRQAGVVGKFVEFHGEGTASLSVPDRATLGNMAPEYGATIGFFPFDEQSCRYLRATGRSDEQVETARRYFQAQGLFGMPVRGQCDYTIVLDVDLAATSHRSQAPAPAGTDRAGALKRSSSRCSPLRRAWQTCSEVARAWVRWRGEEPRPGGGEQSDDQLPTAARRTQPDHEAG